MRKIFLYNTKVKLALKRQLQLPDTTVRFALDGRIESELAKMIRDVAINEYGGFYAPKKTERLVQKMK